MEEKSLIKAVIRALHPDLFTAYPLEQEINSIALKKLNNYLDQLAEGSVPDPIDLEFWIKTEDSLKEIYTELGSDGSLAPLYFSLGLIDETQYRQWTLNGHDRIQADLLDWLKKFVDKVVRDGEQHSILRSRFHKLQHEVETKHQLKSAKAKIHAAFPF